MEIVTSQAVLGHLAGGETKIIPQENIISESVARALESLSFGLFFFGGWGWGGDIPLSQNYIFDFYSLLAF